eukprot:4204331-Amphidinium_carterae.1
MVGVLRLPNFPLLFQVELLETRSAPDVAEGIARMINLFEALEFEGFPITPHRRVRRIHTDRARELTSEFLETFLTRYPQVLLTHTKGYDPQASGTAERGVGMIKALVLRSLTHSGLPKEFWSFASVYAAQSLLCCALQ